LVAKGAVVNALDNNQDSPLHITCRDHYHPVNKVVNILLQHGGAAIVNTPNSEGFTPFLTSCQKPPRKELFMALLNAGGDINVRDKYGNTPLHHLLRYSDDSCCEKLEILLSRGTDIHQVNNEHLTPLHTACWNRRCGAK